MADVIASYGAGDIDRRVTIQQKGSGQDASGQRVDTWTDVGVVWARIAPLSGRELIAGQALHAEVTTEILMRYRVDVKPDMRIVHNSTGEVYDVHAVRDVEKRRVWLVLSCTDGMTEG